MGWEETLWLELKAQPDAQQIITTGEWITKMVQEILPALGRYRRQKVIEILALPDWDATRLAETIGARRNTISRLAEEGRKAAREERDRTVDEPPPLPGSIEEDTQGSGPVG